VERVGTVCSGEGRDQFYFFLVVEPGRFITVGCGVVISSPQIPSFPLPAFLKKGGRKEKKYCLLESKWKIKYDLLRN